MAPRQHHIVKAAVGFVDTVFGRVYGVMRIWVALEGFGIYVLV